MLKRLQQKQIKSQVYSYRTTNTPMSCPHFKLVTTLSFEIQPLGCGIFMVSYHSHRTISTIHFVKNQSGCVLVGNCRFLRDRSSLSMAAPAGDISTHISVTKQCCWTKTVGQNLWPKQLQIAFQKTVWLFSSSDSGHSQRSLVGRYKNRVVGQVC